MKHYGRLEDDGTIPCTGHDGVVLQRRGSRVKVAVVTATAREGDEVFVVNLSRWRAILLGISAIWQAVRP